MKAILITGMSGTGKSTAITDLLSRGYHAFDLDNDPYSVWVDAEPDPECPDNEVKPGKDWVWDEEQVHELLTTQKDNMLFVSGCASNMSKFYPYFDHIILLTAPGHIIAERLRSRQGNTYGQSPEELARVLRLKETIEPLLREKAELEIDTSITLSSTIDLILQQIGITSNKK